MHQYCLILCLILVCADARRPVRKSPPQNPAKEVAHNKEQKNKEQKDDKEYLKPIDNKNKRWRDLVHVKHDSRTAALWGFILPPPAGQLYNGNKKSALLWGGAFAISVGLTIFFHKKYVDYYSDGRTKGLSDSFHRYRDIGIASSIAIWALGALQAYIHASMKKVFNVSDDISVVLGPEITTQSVGVGVDVNIKD